MTEEQLKEANEYIESIGLENVENIVVISSEATNGGVIEALFPCLRAEDNGGSIYLHYPHGGWLVFDRGWWYAPYTGRAE